MTTAGSLPEDATARNAIPMADGLLYYFPNALAAVAEVSRIGNEQHNPGEPLHWARDKSTDHENKILRHLVDAGKRDSGGVRHSARLAWRALALLQEEIERDEGVPLPRNAWYSSNLRVVGGQSLLDAILKRSPDLAAGIHPAGPPTYPKPPQDSVDAAVDAILPPGTPPGEE